MTFHPNISELGVRMTASRMPEDMETQVAVLEGNIARGGMNDAQRWTACDKYGRETEASSQAEDRAVVRSGKNRKEICGMHE
jgi:hypothetical protein